MDNRSNDTTATTVTAFGRCRQDIKQTTGDDGIVVIPLPKGQLTSLTARREGDGTTVSRTEAVVVPAPREDVRKRHEWAPLRIVVAGGDSTR